MRWLHSLFACGIAIPLVVQAADPTCSRGIKSPNNPLCCCPPYCGSCDDGACASHPGGYWECCNQGVVAKGQKCNSAEAPCIMQAAAPPAQNNNGGGGGGGGAVQRPVQLGIYAGDPNKDIWSRINEYGVRVDSQMIYMNVNFLSFYYIQQILNTGLYVTLVLEFWESYPNLWDIAGGKYDSKLWEFFSQMKQDGRRISVRLLHEFNGNWYNWGVYSGGSNSGDAYKAAFRHASAVIRSTGANVLIQAGYNSLNANNDGTALQNFYPGDDSLDMICVSAYNFCGLHGWTNQKINDIIRNWYDAMVSVTNKPLCISEMSSTNRCNNAKGGWLYDTWCALAWDFPRITSINWFLENHWSIGEDLDLNDGYQISEWRAGAQLFKQVTGYAQGDTPTSPTADEKKKRADALVAQNQYQQELSKRGLKISPDIGVSSGHASANIGNKSATVKPGVAVIPTTTKAPLLPQVTKEGEKTKPGDVTRPPEHMVEHGTVKPIEPNSSNPKLQGGV